DHKGCGVDKVRGVVAEATTSPASSMSSALAPVVEMSMPRKSFRICALIVSYYCKKVIRRGRPPCLTCWEHQSVGVLLAMPCGQLSNTGMRPTGQARGPAPTDDNWMPC